MEDFPRTLEALTPGWLSKVMGSRVRGFRVERFGAGAGLIGQVVRLHLDWDEGPASIIAKFPTASPANRVVAETYDMYGREIDFYRRIAPRVTLRVPHCYHAAFDDREQDFVLLIEDLSRYRIGDQVTGCTLDEARAVLRALARFHASVWAPADLDDVVLHDNARQRDGMVAGFGVGWPACLERFPQLIPESARHIAAHFPANVPRLMREMCRDPVCLIHGDVRIDNVFFGPDEVALVDWQAVCRSAPEHDVAYFVTQSVPQTVRAGADLHAFYHDVLAGELAVRGIDYPRADSRRRYEVAALYLLCYAVVIAGTLDTSNDRGLALATGMLHGSLSALDAMNAFRLLE